MFIVSACTVLGKHRSINNYPFFSFPLDEDSTVSVIAWTTTPWTLPSNLALCVHPHFIYVKVKGNNKSVDNRVALVMDWVKC